jgi:hypothetical protein
MHPICFLEAFMKALFVVGLAVLILGILSFFVAVPHSENHGIKAGDVNIGIQTHESEKVAPAVSVVLLVVGAGLMIAGRKNWPQRYVLPPPSTGGQGIRNIEETPEPIEGHSSTRRSLLVIAFSDGPPSHDPCATDGRARSTIRGTHSSSAPARRSNLAGAAQPVNLALALSMVIRIRLGNGHQHGRAQSRRHNRCCCNSFKAL